MLQLLRLFRVIEGQCVKVSRAPNFELCLLLSSYCLGGNLLYACLYFNTSNRDQNLAYITTLDKQLTRSIFPPGDLDELLNITNFLGLFGIPNEFSAIVK